MRCFTGLLLPAHLKPAALAPNCHMLHSSQRLKHEISVDDSITVAMLLLCCSEQNHTAAQHHACTTGTGQDERTECQLLQHLKQLKPTPPGPTCCSRPRRTHAGIMHTMPGSRCASMLLPSAPGTTSTCTDAPHNQFAPPAIFEGQRPGSPFHLNVLSAMHHARYCAGKREELLHQ